MLKTIFATTLVFMLFVFLMALGVIFQRKPIKGSCGGAGAKRKLKIKSCCGGKC